jgi:HSP20 family protein
MAITKFSSGFPSLFDRFFDGERMDRINPDYSPADANLPMVNIKENADEYLIEVAAPGMKKNDFKITYDNGKLTISSDKKEEVQDGVSYMRREYTFHSFQRSFDVSEDLVDGGKIHANYNDGILQITLPKREEAKPKPGREISIT